MLLAGTQHPQPSLWSGRELSIVWDLTQAADWFEPGRLVHPRAALSPAGYCCQAVASQPRVGTERALLQPLSPRPDQRCTHTPPPFGDGCKEVAKTLPRTFPGASVCHMWWCVAWVSLQPARSAFLPEAARHLPPAPARGFGPRSAWRAALCQVHGHRLRQRRQLLPMSGRFRLPKHGCESGASFPPVFGWSGTSRDRRRLSRLPSSMQKPQGWQPCPSILGGSAPHCHCREPMGIWGFLGGWQPGRGLFSAGCPPVSPRPPKPTAVSPSPHAKPRSGELGSRQEGMGQHAAAGRSQSPWAPQHGDHGDRRGEGAFWGPLGTLA